MKQSNLKAKTQLKAKSVLQSGKKLKKNGSRGTGSSSQKQKLKSVSQLKKIADKYYSLATRLRFADKKGDQFWVKCMTCPNYKPVKQMQCGHFMSRAHNATRYSDENCAPQCYGCNVMHQGRQYQFGLEIDKLYGEGTAARLHQEAQQLHPFTREELLEVIESSKEEIRFYERSISG